MDNIIKYLVKSGGFKITEGISDFSYSYAGVTRTILNKEKIEIVIGLIGGLHLSLMIKKNGNMAFYQDAMQVTEKNILEIIEKIKSDDYYIIEKTVRKIMYSPDNHISTELNSNKEYEYPLIKDLL